MLRLIGWKWTTCIIYQSELIWMSGSSTLQHVEPIRDQQAAQPQCRPWTYLCFPHHYHNALSDPMYMWDRNYQQWTKINQNSATFSAEDTWCTSWAEEDP